MEAKVELVLPANNAKFLDMSTDEGKAFKKMKVQNVFAVCYFRLGLNLPKSLKMIEALKSLEWPSELVCDLV